MRPTTAPIFSCKLLLGFLKSLFCRSCQPMAVLFLVLLRAQAVLVAPGQFPPGFGMSPLKPAGPLLPIRSVRMVYVQLMQGFGVSLLRRLFQPVEVPLLIFFTPCPSR